MKSAVYIPLIKHDILTYSHHTNTTPPSSSSLVFCYKHCNRFLTFSFIHSYRKRFSWHLVQRTSRTRYNVKKVNVKKSCRILYLSTDDMSLVIKFHIKNRYFGMNNAKVWSSISCSTDLNSNHLERIPSRRSQNSPCRLDQSELRLSSLLIVSNLQ